MCEAMTREYRIPTFGWSTKVADPAAKVFSIGFVEALAQRLARSSAPIGSADAHDAFDHAEKAVLAIHNRRETDKWELRDPDSSPRPPHGPYAAGVPCLALPPKLEGSAPNVADHLVPKTDELREVRSIVERCVER